MPVEFEMEINVQTSTRGGYRTFIENLRVRLGVRSSHNRPALAEQEEPPTRFFDLVIRTNDHSVRFRLRMDNLYLIGYQMENGQWLEFNNNIGVHLILEQGTTFLGFDGSYNRLANVAHLNMEQIRVGFYNLGYGINQLATSTAWEIRARYLIVVIMMICESTRLNPIFKYMATNFDNSNGTSSSDYNDNRNREGQIQPWITNLVRAWYSFSAALLRADAYPGESFQLRRNVVRVPPDYREVSTIAQAAEILGILLGLCFRGSGPKRFPRMTFDEGQCFLGLPLVQVFSVRIDNIDDEDPGDLYGTITVNDGLNIEYIYNRTSSDPESIKPGQNASLTGPSQSILAFGNFTIKLLLTDKDWFWDDEIINKDISWDASEIGNVYDKSIVQKLFGKRGSATVNYAVLRNAVAARITVTLVEGGESTANVYGQVYAHYDNWDDPSNTTCLLFNRSSGDWVDVSRRQTIPLLRSVVAVPLNGSLIVKANLSDSDIFFDDKIAEGAVKFPAKMSGTSWDKIQGEDGNFVTVTVYWTSEI